MSDIALVVLGASLGGIEALSAVLKELPADFPAPVAIVLHRRPDSASRLAEILGSRCALRVIETEDKTPLAAGTVYLAPPDYHLLVEPRSFALSLDEPECFARPSIDVLFESAADAFGAGVVAVLLTGANEDGAEGIVAVRRSGGVTIVQDPLEAESPVAPRSALARGPVDHVLPLVAIGRWLREASGSSSQKVVPRPGTRSAPARPEWSSARRRHR